MVTATASPVIRRMVCMATLLAPPRSPAPIMRASAASPPVPRPLANPMVMMKSGNENPTAARASAPRPATQNASTTL
ncbi:MAG: hypothetical protein BWX50_01538 [Euryarchaeota archaeon ADurb.Bin009]|nr:MAG: hypothetical protein BWX50_01538 [Euryarchaeota archaeon ADurb.Bin009]